MYKCFAAVNLSLCLSLTTTVQGMQLLFASDLIRHGARTAIHYSNRYQSPASWSIQDIPAGQLTQFGFYQEKSNGTQFKHRYQHLLPNHYSNKSICIRSDAANRTIMSAIAVMSSLYPNSRTLAVEYISKANDPLLHPNRHLNNALAHAPGWRTAWQHAKFGYRFYKRLYDQHLIGTLCPKSSAQTTMHCFEAIKPLADAAISSDAYCQHNISHCSATKLLGITRQQLNNITQVKNWYTLHAFLPSHQTGFNAELPIYQRFGRQTGCPLVSEVVHNMQVSLSHKSTIKYVLYSAHDGTLLTVLNYLISKTFKSHSTLPLHGNPGFAADLSFQLLSDNHAKPFVKIIYRNTPSGAPKVVFYGSFKQFKRLYFSQSCLKQAQANHRCDFL